MLIDTHTHLYVSQFDEDRPEVMARAAEAGVSRFFLPNIDVASIPAIRQMQVDYPDRVFPMMGLHPCSVKADYQEQLDLIKQELWAGPYCAVGEVGIDLYWDSTFLDQQIEAFTTQMDWAVSLNKPVIIHSRESTQLIIDLIRAKQSAGLWGIFHCFSGTKEQANQIIDLGFHLGIGGVLTFKKAGLDKVVADLPLEWLVLETDSPYLTPSPHRGKRNESAYVRYVAEKLAEIKGVSLEEIGKVTSENAQKVFRTVPWPSNILI